MKKDIPFSKVEDVAVAVIPGGEESDQKIWEVFLVNLKPDPLETVLVSSKGYGHYKGRDVKTSINRQLLGTVKAKSYTLIEPIDRELFGISNEYWVSFWHKGVMYDKKFVFVTESISADHFTTIPILEKQGVMIK